jgi:hypothetical protein
MSSWRVQAQIYLKFYWGLYDIKLFLPIFLVPYHSLTIEATETEVLTASLIRQLKIAVLKVKFSLEQDMKSQWGSRGIALLFL